MNNRRFGLSLILVFLALFASWVAFIHRRDASAFGYISRRLGLASDRNTLELLKTMQVYASRERYDLAIAAGENWTVKHSIDGSNDQVFLAISSTYLERARRDKQNPDAYLFQAILYRNKALPTASDRALGWYSIGTLREMALVSETVGDLSEQQRCTQYRNALKLHQQVVERLNEKRDEVSRRTPAEDNFGVTLDEVNRRIFQTVDLTKRLEAKVQSGTCE